MYCRREQTSVVSSIIQNISSVPVGCNLDHFIHTQEITILQILGYVITAFTLFPFTPLTTVVPYLADFEMSALNLCTFTKDL